MTVFQVDRLTTYVRLLKTQLASHPELEPSLVETTIGEDEEGIKETNPAMNHATHTPVQKKPGVQSSIDRYSYRAAIFQNDRLDLDLI